MPKNQLFIYIRQCIAESICNLVVNNLTLLSIYLYNNMKKIISFLLLAISVIGANAQDNKPTIEFEKVIYDFGTVKEDGGNVSYTFKYTNKGKTPLVIHNVQASCGCTTPEWTRTPIPAGASGEIKVTFNPTNRPGSFNKTISVASNAKVSNLILRITGNVSPRQRTLEDDYPVLIDSLRLSDSHIAMTKLTPNATKEVEIKCLNISSKPIKPEFINVPSHITIEAMPATIAPGKTGIIKTTYNATLKNDWGFVTDQIYVIFDGVRNYKNRLTVSATIEENFSGMTEAELADAPVISFAEKTFDFGNIPPTQKVDHSFVLKNDGKNDLVIRKVKASCGCTAVRPAKTILKAGETTEVLVTFDPRGKSGRQSKTVTIISNDPKSSNIMLRIQGNVTTADSNVVK